MTYKYVILAVVLSQAGCASGMVYDGAAEEAVSVALPAFGAPDWPVPPVFVLPQDRMNCLYGSSVAVPAGMGQGWLLDGKCVDGASFEPSFERGSAWIEIAQKPTWHESALCHEMGHASRFMRGIDGDQEHTSDTFSPGGTVELCQELLTQAGL